MEYQNGYNGPYYGGGSFSNTGMNNQYSSFSNAWGANVSGNNGFENEIYRDPMFNPAMQYEQAYMYYRYLTQQIEYKIKCKELDQICGHTGNNGNCNNSRNEGRRIE